MSVFSFGDYQFDCEEPALSKNGEPVAIGHKAAALLRTLLEADGKPVSKQDLLDAVWPGMTVEESNLSVQIAALRKLLGAPSDGIDWIVTVPRLGYRFARLPGSEQRQADVTLSGDVPEDPRDGPSIAVLPFANLSGDIDQEYLADGIAEDIITALTRCGWLHVASRNAGFVYKGRSADPRLVASELGVRYVLEGSVRRAGDVVRVSVQLVDAAVGHDIWAHSYDMRATDTFAIQDEIALRVVAAIEPTLLTAEAARAVRRKGAVSALDTVRQGTWYFHKVTRTTHLKARELFRRALKADPELIEANFWLGRVAAGVVALGWAKNPEAEIAEGIDAALKAVELDGLNPYSHYALAISRLYADLPAEAASAARRAIQINPGFALGYLMHGHALFSAGDAAGAVDQFARGLELNANDPQNFVWNNLLAISCYLSGAPERGAVAAANAAEVRPEWVPALRSLALCHDAAGDHAAALRVCGQLARLDPPAGDTLGPFRKFNPKWAVAMDEALARLTDEAAKGER
ncbi:winged helix-turn-helix domain-containing protein [Oricola sp.]|uniref:winged helix-turn-helix domain-containing protein n=1 Tax=Oricola sp. TaxID=1979950 RepID=UPI003BAA3CA0